MKNKIIPIFVITLLAFGVGSSVFAYQGDYTKKGPNYTEERHTLIEKAFSSNDYDAWKKIMEETNSGKRVLSVVNKDNFSKFVQAHNLGEQGKTVEANKIREELGLGNGNKTGQGNGQGLRNGSGMRHSR